MSDGGAGSVNDNPLDVIGALCASPADAVRWACVLEASAPKAGNVFPGHPFDDLCFEDFVGAAEITAQCVANQTSADSDSTFGHWVLETATKVRLKLGTNVNLGILLLLGPLVQCDLERATSQCTAPWSWQNKIREVISAITPEDSAKLFATIQVSQPGGMGKVDEMDLDQTQSSDATDIVAAMRLAKDRDRIALQYADDFQDFFANVVPIVNSSIRERGDILCGIADAHLRLLSATPDSLIARKHGKAIAELVQRLSDEVDFRDPIQRQQFDADLRGGQPDLPQRCNPGTTADLIAAALYVLLRTQ